MKSNETEDYFNARLAFMICFDPQFSHNLPIESMQAQGMHYPSGTIAKNRSSGEVIIDISEYHVP
jgi:hypothetical protein